MFSLKVQENYGMLKKKELKTGNVIALASVYSYRYLLEEIILFSNELPKRHEC